MKIMLNEKNRKKIEVAVIEANGKAKERTITASDIYAAAEAISSRVNIPKKDMVGIKAAVDLNAQHMPRAYKWRASSTQFRLEYFPSGWALVWIGRNYLTERNATAELILTSAALEAIARNYTAIRI